MSNYINGLIVKHYLNNPAQTVFEQYRKCFLTELFARPLLTKREPSYFKLIGTNWLVPMVRIFTMTLGVGGDVAAEEKMKTKFPSTCQFHGADPGETNAIDYAPIGKFHKVTVGSYSQTWDGVVVARQGLRNTEMVKTKYVPFVEFLREYVKVKKIVDVLLIDIEFAEYDFLPIFFKNGKLDASGFIVCQFNVEIHSPSQQPAVYFDILLHFLIEKKYLPMIISSYLGHIRAYFINYSDEICRKRYLSHMII
ncbi:unnamed protein product [Dracunculus medinensis]|uniref:Methyltransf_21 domain-containing protein n=1 Tax=Dracunculus medinensis TaxID=318479 RepID=A0A0N4UDY2_DRAME|nr:unnamed protein product [Dracunculus medinensis]